MIARVRPVLASNTACVSRLSLATTTTTGRTLSAQWRHQSHAIHRPLPLSIAPIRGGIQGNSLMNTAPSYLTHRHLCTNNKDTPPIEEAVDWHHHHPDGLTRYPSHRSANGLLRALDWIGMKHFTHSVVISSCHIMSLT
jgi:hypothetical protein